MKEDHLVSLIVRQLSGELDFQGVGELEEWAKKDVANRQLLDRVSNESELQSEISRWKDIDPAVAYEKWAKYWKNRRRTHVIWIAGWSAAAVLMLCIVIAGVLQRTGSTIPSVTETGGKRNLVAPGRNTAILTLASGRQILLDSASNGQLALQGNSRLLKTGDGILSYEARSGSNSHAEIYNVLTTPRSGQYRLSLPDGTRVWLNNVSSIRYPISFQGKERSVELTGEAYFEVANDATRPFVVKVKDENVEVLGTSFNIMAYPEEGGTQTTLLNGAVRVSTKKTSAQLKVDEQAEVVGKGELRIYTRMPSQDIVSWKDGFFYFGRASLAAMMRQLARWYDVEIVYEGKAPEIEFGGKLDRALPLNDLLKFLDRNQIHFRLDGRKLIVLPS